MSLRSDWQVSGVRRNFNAAAIIVRPPQSLTLTRRPVRAWQRDVSEMLPRLFRARRARLGHWARGYLDRLRLAARRPSGVTG